MCKTALEFRLALGLRRGDTRWLSPEIYRQAERFDEVKESIVTRPGPG